MGWRGPVQAFMPLHLVLGLQIYNPPVGLYKSIKSGLVLNDGDLLEKSLVRVTQEGSCMQKLCVWREELLQR